MDRATKTKVTVFATIAIVGLVAGATALGDVAERHRKEEAARFEREQAAHNRAVKKFAAEVRANPPDTTRDVPRTDRNAEDCEDAWQELATSNANGPALVNGNSPTGHAVFVQNCLRELDALRP